MRDKKNTRWSHIKLFQDTFRNLFNLCPVHFFKMKMNKADGCQLGRNFATIEYKSVTWAF